MKVQKAYSVTFFHLILRILLFLSLAMNFLGHTLSAGVYTWGQKKLETSMRKFAINKHLKENKLFYSIFVRDISFPGETQRNYAHDCELLKKGVLSKFPGLFFVARCTEISLSLPLI
jgi:hypothetical protein